MQVNFQLVFRGEQDEMLPKLLIGMLIENAHRSTIDGIIVLSIGPLFVFEESLQQGNTMSSVIQGGGTTLGTPSGRSSIS